MSKPRTSGPPRESSAERSPDAPVLLPLPPARFGAVYGERLLAVVIMELTGFHGEHGDQLTPHQMVEIVRLAQAVERLLEGSG